jgi:DNA polymerase elongation subunit (family B)
MITENEGSFFLNKSVSRILERRREVSEREREHSHEFCYQKYLPFLNTTQLTHRESKLRLTMGMTGEGEDAKRSDYLGILAAAH